MSQTLLTRDAVLDVLRREIVGPDPLPGRTTAEGEEVLPRTDPPRYRYAAGVLFPRKTPVEAQGEGHEPTEVHGPEDPEEEANRGPGDVAPVTDEHPDDAEADEYVVLEYQHLPSSMGLTCCIDSRANQIEARVSAATYSQNEMPELPGKRGYARRPLQFAVEVPITPGTGKALVTDAEGPTGLELRWVVRESAPQAAARFLTVSLVNALPPSATVRTEECFYQAGLFLRTAEPGGFRPIQPDRCPGYLDDEEASVSLLYRYEQIYAIGHGVAANWGPQVGGCVDEVWTEALSVHEVKPIVPASLEGVDLRISRFGLRGDSADALTELDKLCARYGTWVEQQRKEATSLVDEQHRRAATRHITECEHCLERMRGGLRLLREDGRALQAFRIANEAMLLQQAHYALPLRRWSAEGEVEPVEWPNPADPSTRERRWYPFQVAFLLLGLRSIARPQDSERQLVDLLWFPTGGGKTEAYLALAAFTMVYRRLVEPADAGTAVLMRYTLRLLTAQQFQRASSLVCALEFIRKSAVGPVPGDQPFRLGLWAGGELSPNTREAAREALAPAHGGPWQPGKFILQRCPWCGVQFDNQDRPGYEDGLVGRQRTVIFRCPDSQCPFHGGAGLPLTVIDEDIYAHPPTMVIGTVDKFAMLPWRPEAGVLFGIGAAAHSAPDLVIQDELHLISGPLGSMVGFYETLIHELCTEGGVPPKVVASTATICRSQEQCHDLYACGPGNVHLFPPQCLTAGESFFATVDTSRPGRVYVGVLASALSSHVAAQVRIFGSLLQAAEIARAGGETEVDPYTTLVGYFGTLRELGHALAMARDSMAQHARVVARRRQMERCRHVDTVRELTSRVSGPEVTATMAALSIPHGEEGAVDLCLATNMVSVGLDVPRLGLMAVVGQPKTTSEYIQATSRVGRRHPGLVVTIYSPGRPRDRSCYERFHGFHAALYRAVEPTGVTPFTRPVRDRALAAILVGFVRLLGAQHAQSPHPAPTPQEAEAWIRKVAARAAKVDPGQADDAADEMARLLAHWTRVAPGQYGGFARELPADAPLMHPAGSKLPPDWEGRVWSVPSSMRSVDRTARGRQLAHYVGHGDA